MFCYHGVDLLDYNGKAFLVWDGDTLDDDRERGDGDRTIVGEADRDRDRDRDRDDRETHLVGECGEVDMGKAALGDVAVDDDDACADLYGCS